MPRSTASSTTLSSATGQAHRCTLSGAPGTPASATRFWYISSAMNGAKGASSLATVTRHS